MPRDSIAVVEPQMHNLFHSPFNAALLHAIVLAFPDAAVSFSALPGHASAVREILRSHAPGILGRVEWRELKPLRSQSVLYRLWSNRRILLGALRREERVVFCSISRLQLLQLKLLMLPGDEVLAVLHGDLERIAGPEPEGFPASLYALKSVLLSKHPRGLRYVLLGESIRKNIPAEFDEAFWDAVVIEHPCHLPGGHLPGGQLAEARPSPASEPVVFGVFGNSGDGRLLEEVAREVKGSNPGIVFRLIGFVADGDAAARLAALVEGAGTEPISREEFARRAESITYALWLAPAGSFKLRASGTFFDALAYAKPLVYVANDFIDGFQPAVSEIGFRCAEPRELARAILRIAEGHDAGTYAGLQGAIREFRLRFTPQALARALPLQFGWEAAIPGASGQESEAANPDRKRRLG
jgi:hypothetical protein